MTNRVEIRGADLEGEFLSLLNRAFSVPEGADFFDDFPVWSEKAGFSPIRYGIRDPARGLVASAAGRMARLKTGAEVLDVGLIGAVATDPDFRGRGHASGLVEAVVSDLRLRGAAIILLWGSEHSLYSKLGFDLCGVQARIPLEEMDLKWGESWTSPVECGGWRPEIFRLMRQRRGGLILEGGSENWVASHSHVEWVVTGRSGKAEAYAAIGRGIDLEGMIHEWGGEPAALHGILAGLKRTRPRLSLLGCPFFLGDFGISFEEKNLEYLGLCRVLDPVRVIQAFRPDARVAGVMIAPSGWDLEVNGHRFSAVDEKELPKLLFGPEVVRNIQSEVLPPPLWIWGLDAA